MSPLSDFEGDYEDRPKGSCLARKKPIDSPKKQVSFCMDKENDLYSIGLPDAEVKFRSRPSAEVKVKEKRRPASAGTRAALNFHHGYTKESGLSTEKFKLDTGIKKDKYRLHNGVGKDLYRNGTDLLLTDIYRGASDYSKVSPRDQLSTETRLQQAHTQQMNELRDRLKRAEARSSELRYGDYNSKYSVYNHKALGIR